MNLALTSSIMLAELLSLSKIWDRTRLTEVGWYCKVLANLQVTDSIKLCHYTHNLNWNNYFIETGCKIVLQCTDILLLNMESEVGNASLATPDQDKLVWLGYENVGVSQEATQNK